MFKKMQTVKDLYDSHCILLLKLSEKQTTSKRYHKKQKLCVVLCQENINKTKISLKIE